LDNLVKLKKLMLENNRIEEIKGLEHLTDLNELNLAGNPIREDEKHLLKRKAREVVKYCQEKKDGKLEFVIFEGERIYAINDLLDLNEIGITDLSEIKGLENLICLKN